MMKRYLLDLSFSSPLSTQELPVKLEYITRNNSQPTLSAACPCRSHRPFHAHSLVGPHISPRMITYWYGNDQTRPTISPQLLALFHRLSGRWTLDMHSFRRAQTGKLAIQLESTRCTPCYDNYKHTPLRSSISLPPHI